MSEKIISNRRRQNQFVCVCVCGVCVCEREREREGLDGHKFNTSKKSKGHKIERVDLSSMETHKYNAINHSTYASETTHHRLPYQTCSFSTCVSSHTNKYIFSY